MISRWLGEDRPKQFCAFLGTRTMLEHTFDRAAAICSPQRVLTVISRGQRPYLDEILRSRRRESMEWIVEQPIARGTAPGLYGGLSYIIERDPEATVIVLPSDHFIYPEVGFLRCLEAAAEAVARWEDKIVLLAARPTGPETDYGWIDIGPIWRRVSMTDPDLHVGDVLGFHEKPDAVTARDLYRRQGLWNTMVMVGKARTFTNLGWRALPNMMCEFEILRQVLRAVWEGRVPPDHEEYALSHVYGILNQADFSRDVLQRSFTDTLVLPMENIQWSDWGRPERLLETVERLAWPQGATLSAIAACQ